MAIVVLLLGAWLVLNTLMLAAVAVAHRHGQRQRRATGNMPGRQVFVAASSLAHNHAGR